MHGRAEEESGTAPAAWCALVSPLTSVPSHFVLICSPCIRHKATVLVRLGNGWGTEDIRKGGLVITFSVSSLLLTIPGKEKLYSRKQTFLQSLQYASNL